MYISQYVYLDFREIAIRTHEKYKNADKSTEIKEVEHESLTNALVFADDENYCEANKSEGILKKVN